mmetsp:Transcript_102902/g.295031  ORF Transcript_102902/g.295031 Transcript_102902/m.295031 type:complete len:551 (-) Transcript_102902:243-1895(-)
MPSYQNAQEAETLLEAAPLTPGKSASPHEPSSSTRKFAGMAIAAAALIAGVAGVTHATGKTAPAAALSEEIKSDWMNPRVKNPTVHQASSGWYFYKSATIARNGTVDTVTNFMSTHTGGHRCAAVNLGCDGYKITCVYGADSDVDDDTISGLWDRQLHYVHAPKLHAHAVDGDDMGTDGWMDFMEESYDGMSEFNGFMHNKFTMFTGDIEAKAVELQNDNHKMMKRLSIYHEGGYSASITVSLEGYIWEFVGFAPDACANPEAADCSYALWSEDECPAAHTVDVNMTALTGMIAREQERKQAGDAFGTGYANSSMWISNSIASSNIFSDEMTLNFDLLKNRTQAQVRYSGGTESAGSPTCNVATIAYANMNEEYSGQDDHVTLKYVTNWKQQNATSKRTEKTYSIYDYETYIARVHKKYLTRPHSGNPDDMWRNWDHFLDQHIGIKWYRDTPSDMCYNHNQDITSMLKDHHISCGKRAVDGDGDHFYTATPASTMSLEYNTECNYGAMGETNVCTCNAENSNELAFFMNETDQNGSIDDDEYGCHHDDEY